MRIALCQLNTIPGNISYNTTRIIEELGKASSLGAQLAIFPELTIPGYPPKDLLEYGSFVAEASSALNSVQEACKRLRIDALVGTIHPNVFGGKKALLNAAAL